MRLGRRQILHLAAGTATLPVTSLFSWAENYPVRPVHLIVGFFAGGLTDILSRILAEWLAGRFGQQFIVENVAGAGTNIATERVVRASPDGYTLLMATSSNAINATLYDHLNFEFLRDTVPVASVARTPLVMAVNPSFPAKTVPEFIAYAKAHPGEINMATAGKGSTVHLAGELFMNMTGVKLTVVHYRESYLPDMIAGRVQVVFSPIPTSIEQIRAGKLHAIAVTSDAHSPALQEIPTIAEFVPGYEAIVWNKQRRRRHQHWQCIRRTLRSRRLHTIVWHLIACVEWRSVPLTGLQSDDRPDADLAGREIPVFHVRAEFLPSQIGQRVYRLCEGSAGKARHGFSGHRKRATSRRTAIPANGRNSNDARALSRRSASIY